MSVSKKSFTGNQQPPKPDPPKTPAAGQSPLQKVKVHRGGPGMTKINLTRQEVEEKLGKYRQQQAATNQGSVWQRLASVFRKSSKSG